VEATARRLAVMIRHVPTDETEYAYARPAFTAMKLRRWHSRQERRGSTARPDLGAITGTRKFDIVRWIASSGSKEFTSVMVAA
jgi:hypothetical protein